MQPAQERHTVERMTTIDADRIEVGLSPRLQLLAAASALALLGVAGFVAAAELIHRSDPRGQRAVDLLAPARTARAEEVHP
jgi:hypothetical protein